MRFKQCFINRQRRAIQWISMNAQELLGITRIERRRVSQHSVTRRDGVNPLDFSKDTLLELAREASEISVTGYTDSGTPNAASAINRSKSTKKTK
jgi:hypothetical protein